jgi:metacaspase-1
MAKGIALTIGLNSVDPKQYGGWSGELNACEADATDVADIAKSKGFKTQILVTKAATRKNVIQAFGKAAGNLKASDIFLLFYSGHGGQVPDMNNDEDDFQDETWCLYDGELVDDEIFWLLSRFAKGVRIFSMSDSCHSGTVTKAAFYQGTMAARSAAVGPDQPRFKFMPPDVALRTYRQNQKFYDKILKDPKLTKAMDEVKASVLLVSGCQDNQFSSDGTFNSLFTANLLAVWNNGNFKKNYNNFHNSIVKRMPPDQTPNYFWVGAYDRKFERQTPFTI